VVLIGDFDGDNYTDLIVYGPGAAGDQIWYGHNDENLLTRNRARGTG
jgi:hypothetical protein